MITRDEVKQVLVILDNEYPGMLRDNPEANKIKIDTWHFKLKDFTFEQAQKAMFDLLDNKVYGSPNISDFMEVLKPKMEQVNEGAEFVQSILHLQRLYGTDNMENYVYERWGEVGRDIFKQVKPELRELLTEDLGTFKAQLRTVYNSYKERERHGQYLGITMEQIEQKRRELLEVSHE